MKKFYSDDLYGGFPTDTFAKIDKMFDEMFKPAIENMKSDNHKVIVIDSLPELHRLLEEDAAKSCEQKSAHEDGKVGEYKSTPICFDIQSITANHKKNAFTVVWGDGSHTIIHLQPGDVWDDEKALAMCFVKHMMGDTGSFNDIFTEEMPSKIKHIGKEFTPEEEKVMKMAEAIKELGDTAEKTNESVEQLTFSFDECADYPIFIKTRTAIVPAGHCNTIKGVKERVRELAFDDLGYKPYYYRTWMEDDFLFIDFGNHSKFIVVKGLTTEDWIKA